jgi:hypothetical protein
MSELGGVLSSSLDMGELFEQVGTLVQKLIQVNRLTLSRITNDDKYFVVQHVYGMQLADLPEGRHIAIPAEGALTFRGLREFIACR